MFKGLWCLFSKLFYLFVLILKFFDTSQANKVFTKISYQQK